MLTTLEQAVESAEVTGLFTLRLVAQGTSCQSGATSTDSLNPPPGTEPTVLALGGDLEINTAPPFWQCAQQLVIDFRRIHLVLDLTSLEFVDSHGLSALLDVNRLVQERGGTLVLAGAKGQPGHTLQLSRLHEHLTLVPNVP